MRVEHDTRTEAAIYWATVSLVVCEGLSVRKAAERLGIDTQRVRHILRRRRRMRPFSSPTQTQPSLLQ